MTTSSDGERVRIFDTTLRDGEQAPGATMTSDQKLDVARALSRLGVDCIEAGFPAASPDDLAAVQTIAEEIGARPTPGRPDVDPPEVCGLARASRGDIDKAWEAVKPAARPRIHVFLATSEVHMKHKLRMTRPEVLAAVGDMVAHAKQYCHEIDFSPEDAGRSDPEFLWQVLEVAIRAGATCLNIPDTVGYTLPEEYGAMIAGVKQHVAGVDGVLLSVHCHDDLGLAMANTLSGLRHGARQAQVTINGVGERAGNCALEELVMTLQTRRSTLGFSTGIDATQLCRMSRLVGRATGFAVAPNKAVVGENAFAHESGIHQDGMLKNHETYEIMRPETVGAHRTQLVLGKHSGRNAFATRLSELGAGLDGEALLRAFGRFKVIAERKKQVHDADLLALAADERAQAPVLYELEALQVGCGTVGMPTATVKLRGPEGAAVQACVGTGPVDAAFKAIDLIVGAPVALEEFAVQAVTEGIDALGEVSVRVRPPAEGDPVNAQSGEARERVFHGHAADGDIIVASVKAYLQAINRALAHGVGAMRGAGAVASGAADSAVAKAGA